MTMSCLLFADSTHPSSGSELGRSWPPAWQVSLKTFIQAVHIKVPVYLLVPMSFCEQLSETCIMTQLKTEHCSQEPGRCCVFPITTFVLPGTSPLFCFVFCSVLILDFLHSLSHSYLHLTTLSHASFSTWDKWTRVCISIILISMFIKVRVHSWKLLSVRKL